MKVNGKEISGEYKNIKELLSDLGYEQERIAVEVNGIIIGKEEFDSFTLSSGDKVEVVRFVGGG